MKLRIEREIFEKFPEVRVAAFYLGPIGNAEPSAEISKLLAAEEKTQQKKLLKIDLKTHPRIAPWREIYHQFGTSPRDCPSSVEALARRIAGGKVLPRISSLVDLFNYVSLKYLIPAGVEDLDKISGDLVLGFAKGTEKGVYLGSAETTTCYKGEVIYRDDLGFVCRRWNWREGDRTKVTKETTHAVAIIEANSSLSDEVFQDIHDAVLELINKFFGIQARSKILSSKSLSWSIAYKSGKLLEETDKPMNDSTDDKKALTKAVRGPQKDILPFVLDNKESIKSILASSILPAVKKAISESVDERMIVFEHPAHPDHGDYSANIAMRLKAPVTKSALIEKIADAKTEKSAISPYEVATRIVREWRLIGFPEFVAKVDVARPGFINVWLQKSYVVDRAKELLDEKELFGLDKILKEKKILLEHTSPNPQTTIMLGHLRNNFLGMAVAKLLETLGADVKMDCIVNDRGVHICRSIFGYLLFGQKRDAFKKAEVLSFREIQDERLGSKLGLNWQDALDKWTENPSLWWRPEDLGLKPDHANLVWYVLGSRAYKSFPQAKEAVEQVLQSWEKKDKNVWKIWTQILEWSSEGYKQTYARIGSRHDWTWHESAHYQKGKEIADEGLAKKIFKKSEGAIVTNLKSYGLPDTVIVKTDGTALYLTQDLELTKLKMSRFPSDLYIWDIGAEQALYFRQLFAVCEQLGFGKKEKFFHLKYALINFKGSGKMSTRTGKVVQADEVLDELAQKAREIIKSSNQDLRGEMNDKQTGELAEKVSLAAAKYSLLKFGRDTTIYFDVEESLNLEGNSGPYLQYCYARCQSVLKKSDKSAKELKMVALLPETKLNDEELSLLRAIYQYPEVVLESAQNLAPNLVCNYLFDLAQKYNFFYNKWTILGAKEQNVLELRLMITAATAQVLARGLGLLGIETPERM